MSYWDGLSDHYQHTMKISIHDFHYGPQIPGESSLHLLPMLKIGMKALELGCGGAQNSIFLAGLGLECTAMDISEKQLRHARLLAKKANVKVSFVKSSIEKWPKRLNGPYDLVHSSHALEFVEDPAAAISMAANALAKNGTLVISTVHPLYNGEWVDCDDPDGNENGMGLFLRNYFSPPDDVRKRHGRTAVVSRAYPVSSWFNWLRSAGLEVTALAEPPGLPPDGAPPYTNRAWAYTQGQLQAIPATLILVAKRP